MSAEENLSPQVGLMECLLDTQTPGGVGTYGDHGLIPCRLCGIWHCSHEHPRRLP